MILRDYATAIALLAAATIVFALLRLYQIKANPPPERVRKLVHVFGGILGLSLPWLFDRFAPVLFLGLLAFAAFLTMRLNARIRGAMGQILFAVPRKSVGELCYVTGMLALFWLAHGNKLLYVVPLLMLVVADTAAALVGERYGRIQFQSSSGPKSIEGAIAFFFAAFFCVHVPVLLWSGAGRLESLLISVNLGIMTMLAEATAWWGLDNIIIPLWGYMMLKSQIRMNAIGLSSDLAFVLGLGFIVWLWRDKTTLADDTLCGAVLWDYVVWSVGGWRWALPPLILLLSYATVSFRAPARDSRQFRFPVVLAQIAGSIFWLLLYRQSTEPALYYPFVSCFAADVSIIALVRHKSAVPSLGRFSAIFINTAKSLVIIIPSVLVMDGFDVGAGLNVGACLVAVLAATLLFYELQPGLDTFPVDAGRWLRQATIVAATSTITLAIYSQALSPLPIPRT